MKKIYLAGFDVFYPDSKERGENMKRLCLEHGFQGLYPLDNEVKSKSKREVASLIFQGNVQLIEQADIILANLNRFRGDEPDSGTSFECGLGYGLGKKLYGYVSDGYSLKDRYLIRHGMDITGSVDEDEMTLEDFGLPMNLMLGVSMTMIHGDFLDALKAVQRAEDGSWAMA